ncbi:unnamed protein product [Caenorhabditis nigoni]
MDIQFHTNINDVNSTLANNLPDPNQGFQNSSIGSNVFDAIEKFFSNTQAPVCGSIILILLKRYPNEADNSQLVSLIRSHHASVYVITSATPSGGSQPKTMYSVASKTNGMGPFEYDEHFTDAIGWLPISGAIYAVYATTVQVSGNGTKTLPDFHPPINIRDDYWTVITCQDHIPIDSFQNLNISWTNSRDYVNFSLNSSDVSYHWVGGTLSFVRQIFNGVNYNMNMDFNYLGQDVQSLQIRMYNTEPPSNWLPYSD